MINYTKPDVDKKVNWPSAAPFPTRPLTILRLLFLAWAWLANPKAIVILYQLFRPCHAFTEMAPTEITEKRGKVRTTACKAYQCASKKARGNKNIFSVEHDS